MKGMDSILQKSTLFVILLGLSIAGSQCNDGSESTIRTDWGSVTFRNGMPAALCLKEGSGTNLLQSSGLHIVVGDQVYALANDDDMRLQVDGDRLLAEGVLRNGSGGTAQDPIRYHIQWEVNPTGFLKGDIRLSCRGGFAGPVYYDFAYNSGQLNRYYYTGFFPDDVRQNSSLMHRKMDTIDHNGEILHFSDSIIDRIVGMLHSETEALNIVVGKGCIQELRLSNQANLATLRYRHADTDKNEINTTFYILASPVRKSARLMRVFTAQHRGIERVGVDDFVDTMVTDGFRYFIYHEEWQLPKPPGQKPEGDTDILYGSHRPRDAEITQELLQQCHQNGIQVLFYVGLVNEDSMTRWYIENDGDRFASQNRLKGRACSRRIMCLNTSYYDHLIEDTDYILDSLNADGVYIDWFTYLSCTEPHPSHDGIPVSNINKLIHYAEHVHSKGKLIIVHSGEESRMAFLEDIVDEYIVGERPWSKVNFETIEDGLFDRWSSSVGKVGVINDARHKISEADHRIEINAALAEGLNPFGYVYRPATYEVWRVVPEDEKHSTYLFDILKQLREYEIEQMVYAPAGAGLLGADHTEVVAATLYDASHIIGFIINKDLERTISTIVRVNLKGMGFTESADYQVRVGASAWRTVAGADLAGGAFIMEIPANTAEVIVLHKSQ